MRTSEDGIKIIIEILPYMHGRLFMIFIFADVQKAFSILSLEQSKNGKYSDITWKIADSIELGTGCPFPTLGWHLSSRRGHPIGFE